MSSPAAVYCAFKELSESIAQHPDIPEDLHAYLQALCWFRYRLEAGRASGYQREAKRRPPVKDVLHLLRGREETSLEFVAEAFNITKHTVGQIINELEHRGKVKSRHCTPLGSSAKIRLVRAI